MIVVDLISAAKQNKRKMMKKLVFGVGVNDLPIGHKSGKNYQKMEAKESRSLF